MFYLKFTNFKRLLTNKLYSFNFEPPLLLDLGLKAVKETLHQLYFKFPCCCSHIQPQGGSKGAFSLCAYFMVYCPSTATVLPSVGVAEAHRRPSENEAETRLVCEYKVKSLAWKPDKTWFLFPVEGVAGMLGQNGKPFWTEETDSSDRTRQSDFGGWHS